MKSDMETTMAKEADYAYADEEMAPVRTTSITGHVSHVDGPGHLERNLKSRQLQFLALGGAIGTGLFVGSGAILATVGPAPLFMGYVAMMIIVAIVMNALAEMVIYMPLRGVTIPYLVRRYVEPSLAFATGYNYWYAYSILVAAEVTAGAIVLDYWTSAVPNGAWIAILLLVILLLNVAAVSVFGEAEFWFASIKILTMLGLIILGIVLFFGGGPNHDRLGFRYWQDPGAFIPYMTGGNTGKFLAFWTSFVRAGYAYVTSPELIATASGEAVRPRQTVPKAARRFAWRLLFFYGLGTLVIGVTVPYTDGRLLSGSSNASASPFVIAIQNAGIPVLNHIINAAILTSAWSAANAFLYAGSRTLYSMAHTGQAPKFLRYTTKNGVPLAAVLCTWAVALLAFLNVSESGATVFLWFTNISTISGFIGWIVCLTTYIRFRSALKYQGLLHTLPYKTPWQPYTTYFALFVLIVLTLTNGFQVFFPSQWSAGNFLAAYITLPIFSVLYFGHKIIYRTKFATPIPEIDVTTGKKEVDDECALDREPVPRNWLHKAWLWLV